MEEWAESMVINSDLEKGKCHHEMKSKNLFKFHIHSFNRSLIHTIKSAFLLPFMEKNYLSTNSFLCIIVKLFSTFEPIFNLINDVGVWEVVD